MPDAGARQAPLHRPCQADDLGDPGSGRRPGNERVRSSRAHVVALLNERYAGREVPEVVLDLLDTGWRSVLELAALREGRDGTGFANYLRMIDVLVANGADLGRQDRRGRTPLAAAVAQGSSATVEHLRQIGAPE